MARVAAANAVQSVSATGAPQVFGKCVLLCGLSGLWFVPPRREPAARERICAARFGASVGAYLAAGGRSRSCLPGSPWLVCLPFGVLVCVGEVFEIWANHMARKDKWSCMIGRIVANTALIINLISSGL